MSSDTKRAVDWDEIRARIDRAREALRRAASPGPDESKKILNARAKALAAPDAAPDGEMLKVVEFLLAHETYALETSFVREIRPLSQLTPLPGTPPFVLGIIHLHGEIVSVIDIRKFFDLPDKGLPDLDHVIVVSAGEMTFGILADVVLGVRGVRADELQPSLPTLTGVRAQYLRGITPERSVVLDAMSLILDERIIVRQEVER
jgi:purine-binding chemotaxis protein CheW